MHLNKSAALSSTLTNLLPGSASGQQRNAGMGAEPGASFAALYKSSREQMPPAVPPKPVAASPAPAVPSAPTAEAPQTAAKPVGPKPGAARRQSAAGGEKTQDSDADAAVSAAERKARAGSKPAASKQTAADAEQRAAADVAGLVTDALRAAPAKGEEDVGNDKAEADSKDKPVAVAADAAPQAQGQLAPAAIIAPLPVPPTAPMPDQVATQLLATTRQAEPGRAIETETATANGATADNERQIERSHIRPGEPAVAGDDTATSAHGSDKAAATAATASMGSPLARTELAAAQTVSTEAPATSAKPADAENHAALSFQQLLNQANQPSQTQGSTAVSPGGPAADNRTLPIRQALHSPGFAPAMGAQLSLLASEGVQSAQLLLNPAEMGPVAVQIVLDGQQAQISFHSDQAETRAVLERSLPDLAAALRENGLTLSGGGVFQQDAGTRQQQQADAASQAQGQARGQARGSVNGGVGEHEPLPAAPRRAAAARGVLDTYA